MLCCVGAEEIVNNPQNLTEASMVFMMDSWWNPSVEYQAMDRIHRLGQKRPVKVVKLVVEDSIEDQVSENVFALVHLRLLLTPFPLFIHSPPPSSILHPPSSTHLILILILIIIHSIPFIPPFLASASTNLLITTAAALNVCVETTPHSFSPSPLETPKASPPDHAHAHPAFGFARPVHPRFLLVSLTDRLATLPATPRR
jgi:hypothetical protein